MSGQQQQLHHPQFVYAPLPPGAQVTGPNQQQQPPAPPSHQFTAVFPLGHQFQGQPIQQPLQQPTMPTPPPVPQHQQQPMPNGIRMVTAPNGQQFYAAPIANFDPSLQQQPGQGQTPPYFYPYPNHQMSHHSHIQNNPQLYNTQQQQQQQQHPPSSSTPSNIMQHSAPHTPSPMPSNNNVQQAPPPVQQQMQIGYPGNQLPPSYNYMHPAYLQQSPNVSMSQPPPPQQTHSGHSTSNNNSNQQQVQVQGGANPSPLLQHQQPPQQYHAYQMQQQQQQNPYGK